MLMVSIAGFFFKLTIGMAKLFASERFTSRLVLLESLREVHSLVDHTQVKVSESLVAYDQRLNRYCHLIEDLCLLVVVWSSSLAHSLVRFTAIPTPLLRRPLCKPQRSTQSCRTSFV